MLVSVKKWPYLSSSSIRNKINDQLLAGISLIEEIATKSESDNKKVVTVIAGQNSSSRNPAGIK